jgi:hypothetical protein
MNPEKREEISEAEEETICIVFDDDEDEELTSPQNQDIVKGTLLEQIDDSEDCLRSTYY